MSRMTNHHRTPGERLVLATRRALLAAAGLGVVLLGPASAQPELIVNNEVLCEFSTAAVTEMTQEGSVIVNDPACIVSGGLALTPVELQPSAVLPSETVTVRWASAGADTCTSYGTLPAWNSKTLGQQGPATVTVPAGTAQGNYTIGVNCATGNRNEQKSATLTVNEVPIGNPPPTPTLNRTPSKTTPDGSVTITWNASGANSCEAGGTLPGWSGSKQAGSRSETINLNDVDEDTYTIRLRCSNAAGYSSWATQSLTVEADNLVCTDRPPPSHMTRRAYFRYDGGGGTDFEGVWGPWPGNQKHQVWLKQNEYVALQFNAGDFNPNGPLLQMKVVTEAWNQGNSFGALIWSVSPCPGDFNQTYIENDTSTLGTCLVRGTTFKVGTRESLGVCAIEPNTNYYLNVTTTFLTYPFPVHPDDIVWSCNQQSATSCGGLTETVNSSGW